MVPSIKDILADHNLTSDQKFLLIVIREHAHADGTGAYPSLRRLAALASISMSHLCTLLPALEKTGYLTIERFKGPKGVNAYSLHAKKEVLRTAEHHSTELPDTEHHSTERAPQELRSEESEVQAEERKDPEVLFQAEEHPTTVLHSTEHQDEKQPVITVTDKAAHLVSLWVSPAFSQVLQGKDPEPPSPLPSPADDPSRVPVPPRPPRKFPFDAKRFALGAPCPDDPTHRYGDTGQSLRFITKGTCRACTLAAHRHAHEG